MPTLSLCMIVRNEEQNLQRCLRSVQGLVDEIIIVDTGSTDRTKEIAGKFTDKIFDFPWINDFAAARNESLKHATGEWILMLDADEVLAKQDHDKIRAAMASHSTITSPSVVGFTLVLRNYTNDARAAGWISAKDDSYEESKLASGFWAVSKVRLWRNLPGVKYESSIHESVYGTLSPKGRILPLDVPLHHYGKLDPVRLDQKNKLYEQINQRKAEQEDDFYAYFELGRQYVANHKFSEAVQAFQQSIDFKNDFSESWFMLGSVYLLQEQLELAADALTTAQRLNPTSPSIYVNLGIVLVKGKQYQQALTMFLEAIHYNPSDANAYKNLGLCYDEMGEKEKAYQALKKAVELNPAYTEVIKLA